MSLRATAFACVSFANCFLVSRGDHQGVGSDNVVVSVSDPCVAAFAAVIADDDGVLHKYFMEDVSSKIPFTGNFRTEDGLSGDEDDDDDSR
mmetsp:Transcript_21945/g.46290  ORF Transcript_21945/g.46290 Transcript_21945/m.46290 type:complete len:91 (+) Transcript_21945:770-1042(+)